MVWEITAEELLERYADGERNFAGIKLAHYGLYGFRRSKYGRQLDLDGVVLRDINLRGAYLHEVYLIGADLTGADLGGICLQSCDLTGAIIRDANLFAANVTHSSFDKADLRGSHLDQMNAIFGHFWEVQMGTLDDAILIEADFRGAHIDNGMICRGMNLIWNTTMPNGTLFRGPQWGNGHDNR
ncbi:putative low-complexity protein [Cylindrospermum stagnale PCC 7417]|uniref:Putative low-complexity protein n=1 Tax=Cylindrospermum stagnale PCC 7417 TaxID=56107 RepID=K9X6Q4_9NOST|nr:pentapeptide repeat-containing protein [Cylindrospermum stagnale]AFZ27756.1 putative low-complexity protein [Cylindrospermum stagnale PCC 7417]